MHFTPEQFTVITGLAISVIITFAGLLGSVALVAKVWMEGLIKNMKRDQDAREREAQKDREEVKNVLVESNRKQEAAVSEVKNALEATTDDTSRKLDILHTVQTDQNKVLDKQNIVLASTFELVNSPMGKLLKDYSELAKEHAELTGKEKDVVRADRANQDYAAHQDRQASVDKLPGTNEEKAGKPPLESIA